MNQLTPTNTKRPTRRLVLDRVARTCQRNPRTERLVPGKAVIPMPPGTRRTLRATVALNNLQVARDGNGL